MQLQVPKIPIGMKLNCIKELICLTQSVKNCIMESEHDQREVKMKTTTMTINLNTLSSFTNERYEVISNETLSDCFHKDLNVSGSLLSLSTFKNVTFFGCVFFGSKLQGCTFVNCKFVNCEFKFTQMEDCEFKACEFQGCEYVSSGIKESRFKSSAIDHKTAFVAAKEANLMENCYRPGLTDLESTLPQQEEVLQAA